MVRIKLQFFGGRGASGTGREGGGGGVNPADIISTTSLISMRETKQREVDEALSAFKSVNEKYGYVINDIEVATLKPKASGVMAYYDGSNVAVNETYFNSAAMEKAYAESVKSNWHPSKGKKSAMEAVAAHELGHALTDAAGSKMGVFGIDNISTRIVKEARKNTKHRGVVQMARGVSRYATSSNAEAVAEAFADVYCNGAKAAAESKAIVNVLNSYL